MRVLIKPTKSNRWGDTMTLSDDLERNLAAAAVAIRTADALLIGAGTGMGVDSGLADFRGPEGFWKA